MAHCCEHQDGRAEIIANSEGSRTTASCVAFTETERLIGAPAQNQAASNPTNTVFDVKRYVPPPMPTIFFASVLQCHYSGDRSNVVVTSHLPYCIFWCSLIGQKASDPQVQRDARHFPFAVVAGDDDKPLIEVRGRCRSEALGLFSPTTNSWKSRSCPHVPKSRIIVVVIMHCWYTRVVSRLSSRVRRDASRPRRSPP